MLASCLVKNGLEIFVVKFQVTFFEIHWQNWPIMPWFETSLKYSPVHDTKSSVEFWMVTNNAVLCILLQRYVIKLFEVDDRFCTIITIEQGALTVCYIDVSVKQAIPFELPPDTGRKNGLKRYGRWRTAPWCACSAAYNSSTQKSILDFFMRFWIFLPLLHLSRWIL